VIDKAVAKCEFCSQLPANVETCCAVSEDSYKCTRRVDHTGDHVACGTLDHPIERWTQEIKFNYHVKISRDRCDEAEFDIFANSAEEADEITKAICKALDEGDNDDILPKYDISWELDEQTTEVMDLWPKKGGF